MPKDIADQLFTDLQAGEDGRYEETQVLTWIRRKLRIGVVFTVRDAAARLDVTEQTIRNWQIKPDFPGRPGYYPLKEIRQWQEDIATPGRPSRQISDEERRWQKARADRVELDVDQRRGTLVAKDEIIRWLQRCSARHVAILACCADKVAKRLQEAGLEATRVELARAIVQETINDCRTQIYRDLVEESEEDMSEG